MKKRIYNCISVCFLLFLLVALLPSKAWAEENTETVYYDYTDDQASYGEQVAELISQEKDDTVGGSEGTESGQNQAFFAVLCRAEDGFTPDFAEWNPAYVIAGPQNRYTLFFCSEKAAESACLELSEMKGMRYAEMDSEVTACAEETSFHSWGAERMNYGAYSQYSAQWGGGSVTVAVIDSGVSRHPLLTDRITASGHDFVDNDEDSTNDPFGHGTNVAGVVADCTPGMSVMIYPIRVLNEKGGGSAANVAAGVRAAAAAHVQIINLSLEGSKINNTLDDAILDAVAAGITVVIAAGNKGDDTASYSPAHLTVPGAVIVGSGEADGTKASYSNYGASVDLFAYGTAIRCCSNTGGYKTATGTSVAAPHISALSAMLLLIHPQLSPAQTEYRMTLAAPETEINIPNLTRIIPVKIGFYLDTLPLTANDEFSLLTKALPETALESITYTSSDETVLRIEDGRLIPVSPGTAAVTAACTGFDDLTFTVSVGEDSGGSLALPAQLTSLEDEAFYGAAGFSRVSIPEGTLSIGDHVFDSCRDLQFVSVPDTVTSIGENDFSGAVLLCGEGSAAEIFAEENKREYILTE
ncbi:MAG: S8 family serine peptidase [Oscillospiraceae bacterium]|nr:S8 family serine peptidase [Oscillospiraceae bacterium]